MLCEILSSHQTLGCADIIACFSGAIFTNIKQINAYCLTIIFIFAVDSVFHRLRSAG
jgi:hypothetical protein